MAAEGPLASITHLASAEASPEGIFRSYRA